MDLEFSEVFDVIEYGDEGEYYEKFKNCKWYFPEYDNKLRGEFVWNFDVGNYGYKNDGDCVDCGYTSWILLESNEIMCVKCGKDPDGKPVKLLREKKLNKILKDEN